MNGLRLLKAFSAVSVLLVILLVVTGWWRDYREAVPGDRSMVSQPTTATAEPGSGDDEGEGEGEEPETGEKEPEAAKGPSVEIVIDGLNFRETPEANGKRIRSLDQGEKLTLVKTENGWHQVRDKDGKVGWISGNSQYTKIEGR